MTFSTSKTDPFSSFFTDDNDLYPFGFNAEEGKQNLIQDPLKLSEW